MFIFIVYTKIILPESNRVWRWALSVINRAFNAHPSTYCKRKSFTTIICHDKMKIFVAGFEGIWLWKPLTFDYKWWCLTDPVLHLLHVWLVTPQQPIMNTDIHNKYFSTHLRVGNIFRYQLCQCLLKPWLIILSRFLQNFTHVIALAASLECKWESPLLESKIRTIFFHIFPLKYMREFLSYDNQAPTTTPKLLPALHTLAASYDTIHKKEMSQQAQTPPLLDESPPIFLNNNSITMQEYFYHVLEVIGKVTWQQYFLHSPLPHEVALNEALDFLDKNTYHLESELALNCTLKMLPILEISAFWL